MAAAQYGAARASLRAFRHRIAAARIKWQACGMWRKWRGVIIGVMAAASMWLSAIKQWRQHGGAAAAAGVAVAGGISENPSLWQQNNRVSGASLA